MELEKLGKNLEKTCLKDSSDMRPDGHSDLKPRYSLRSDEGENLLII